MPLHQMYSYPPVFTVTNPTAKLSSSNQSAVTLPLRILSDFPSHQPICPQRVRCGTPPLTPPPSRKVIMSLPYDDLPLPLLLASQPNPNLNRSLNLSIRSGRPITATAENNNNGGGGHQPNRKKKKKKSKSQKRYEAWERYIQDESLAENWERFLHDLGLGDFKSKTQCRKVCLCLCLCLL